MYSLHVTNFADITWGLFFAFCLHEPTFLHAIHQQKKKVESSMYFIFLVPLFCFVKYMFTNCAKKSSKIKAIFRSSPPKIIGGYNFKTWTWVSITKWQSGGNVQILVFSRNTNLKNQAPYRVKLYMRYDCGQSITSFQAKQFVTSESTWLKLKCGDQKKIDMSL